MIIVRADGNKEIGTGHLMRCISIMEQSKERSDIMFLVADQSAKEIIEKKGFLCTVLNTDYKNMESEISKKNLEETGGYESDVYACLLEKITSRFEMTVQL